MSSRFWRAGGNAIRPNSNFLADAVSTATVWTAAADNVLSNFDKTTERNQWLTVDWAPVYASQAKTLWRAGYTIDALGSSTLKIIGMGKAGITTYPGNGAADGIGWHLSSGVVELNGTGAVETIATAVADTDFCEIEKLVGGVFNFYLNSTLVKTVDSTSGTYGYAGNLTGDVYPMVSSHSAPGLKVTISES